MKLIQRNCYNTRDSQSDEADLDLFGKINFEPLIRPFLPVLAAIPNQLLDCTRGLRRSPSGKFFQQGAPPEDAA